MNVNEVLTLIAAQLKADAQALIAYAAEDTLGGYDIDERNRKFPMGSLWEPEGKILYALVRWLKPAVVAEIGGWAGCSASHLALAVQANGSGTVISVDNGVGGQDHGHLLVTELRQFVTLVNADGRDWLPQQKDQSIGLIFEDADHSTELTATLSRLAAQKLEPGGVLVNHDAGHDFAIVGGGARIGSSVGREVRDGLEKAGLYFKPYLADPSDCGVAITVMPGVRNLDLQSMPVAAQTDERPLTTGEDYPLIPAKEGFAPSPQPRFEEDKGWVIEAPRHIDGNSQTGYLEVAPEMVGKSEAPKETDAPKAKSPRKSRAKS